MEINYKDFDQISNALKNCAKDSKGYIYGGFGYSFSFIELSPEAVNKLIFEKRASTVNILARLMNQKKEFIAEMDVKKKEVYRMDAVFRWGSVMGKFQTLGLEIRTETSGVTDLFFFNRKCS